jgi:hypothetical protein
MVTASRGIQGIDLQQTVVLVEKCTNRDNQEEIIDIIRFDSKLHRPGSKLCVLLGDK